MERKVIVLAGPTCSGKTKVAIDLAQKLNTEIISADSRQIYRFLNVGTAKPGADDLARVRHHLIDCFDPDEEYNASRFENDALKIIGDLFGENKIPVVAGGSGLYIRALVNGLFNSVDADIEFREELKRKRELEGNGALYARLLEVDPESASRMLPQNWKRVMRALEVYHLSGETISDFQKKYRRDTDIDFIQFGLRWDRQMLYSNINRRVDDMISGGLVDETKSILALGYSSDLNALNTVGYKEIISYLKGETDLSRAIELIKRNTRRFAKRQLTWFRKDNRINWIDIRSGQELERIGKSILESSPFISNNYNPQIL